MKITGFNPMIVTKDIESVTAIFEALGFEKHHNPTGTSAVGNAYTSYRLTDENGFHVDVSTSAAHMNQDLTGIRINVDNFEEAYDFLTAHGFMNGQNGTVTETETTKACILFSPSGLAINLIQHKKDHN